MIDELQEIVESLAHRIGHTVYLDDAEFRTLAYSSHLEEPDAARLSTLAQREPPTPMRDYLVDLGVRSWRDISVLATDPEMGIEYPRLCFPLRSRHESLGFMWINIREPLDDQERSDAVTVADRLRGLLARHTETIASADAEVAALVREVVSEQTSLESLSRLRSLGMFDGSSHVVVIVGAVEPAVPHPLADGGADLASPPLIRRSIGRATAARPRGTVASAVDEDGAAIVLGYRAAPASSDPLTIAAAIHRELTALDREVAARTRFGVGSAWPDLGDAALSAGQARAALRIAARRDEPVVAWDEHPVEAALTAFVVSCPDQHLVPDVLRQLPRTQSPETLALIQAFLDHAGNVAAVAAALHLHRTTVYERLHRFEETTGLDLGSGAVRLMLQLWSITRD